MNQDQIMAALSEIFTDVFADSSIQLTRTMTASDVAGWDSLTHIQMITAVEEHFGVKFKLTEIMKFKNVGDLCDCIEKHTS